MQNNHRINKKAYHFIQDNYAHSKKNVLRGLHYQEINPQAKLINVTYGEIFDVAVDIRKKSSSFGKFVGIKLAAKDKNLLFIPEGFAHGYLVLSDFADVQYKVNTEWNKDNEKIIKWNDKDLNINWPIRKNLIISSKDLNGLSFNSI